MNPAISLHVAFNCMRLIVREMKKGDYSAIGCTPDQWRLFTGASMWLSKDRAAMKRTLDGCVHYSTEMLGLPQMVVPAEYISAIIALFVDGMNARICCNWAVGAPSAADLGRGDELQTLTDCSPEELFACVCQMIGTEQRDRIAAQFEKSVNMSVAKALSAVN